MTQKILDGLLMVAIAGFIVLVLVTVASELIGPSDSELVFSSKSDSGKIEVLVERIEELEEKVEWLLDPYEDDYAIDKEIESIGGAK